MNDRAPTFTATVGALVLGVACAAATPTPPPGGSRANAPDESARGPVGGAAAASNAFGFSLYGAVAGAKKEDENLVLSPFSAAVALAMTLAGARGETERAMRHTLHLTSLPEPHSAFGEVVRRLADRDGKDGLTLRSSNRLFGQTGFGFSAKFVALLGGTYGAPLGEVDIAREPEAARGVINDFIASRTGGLVPELLSASALAARPRLVLVNALYFRGEWRHRFDPGVTSEVAFRTPGGEVKVPFMRRTAELRYGRVHGAQLLELPYRGGLSMLLALPDAPDGLANLERRIPAGYERWLAALAPRTVQVGLPRWKSSTTLELGDALRALGMGSAFGAGADFSGMLEDGRHGDGLAIGTAVQQATIDVDERGATAAAATAVGMYGLEARDEPEFTATHPFLFFVRDDVSGAVLFAGRVVNPSQAL
jgi:serpin B